MTEEVGDLLVGGYKSAERRKRLGERAHNEIYIVGHAKMMADATSARTEHAYAVRLVDHHARIVFLRKLHDALHVGHVALH